MFEKIRKMAANIAPNHKGRVGCFDVKPHLALKSKFDFPSIVPPIKSGEIVHIAIFDESGLCPGTVYTKEKGGWYPVVNFEIIDVSLPQS